MEFEEKDEWEKEVDYGVFDKYPSDVPEAIIMALKKKPRTKKMLYMAFPQVKNSAIDTAVVYLFGRVDASPYDNPRIKSKKINGKTWYGLLPEFRKEDKR